MTKVFLTQLKTGKMGSGEVKVKLQLGFDGIWPRILPPPKTKSILWRPVRGLVLPITSRQKRTATQSVFVSSCKGYGGVHPVCQSTLVNTAGQSGETLISVTLFFPEKCFFTISFSSYFPIGT